MKQRDNPRSDSLVSDINSRSEKMQGKAGSSTRSKVAPIGFDKRNPKPLVARSFALPQVLQPEISMKPFQHPFLSEELGGNMLNLNQIYNIDKAPRSLTETASTPHIHIEKFLDGFRGPAPATHEPLINTGRRTAPEKYQGNDSNGETKSAGKKGEDFHGITDEDYIEDDTVEVEVEVAGADEVSDTESVGAINHHINNHGVNNNHSGNHGGNNGENLVTSAPEVEEILEVLVRGPNTVVSRSVDAESSEVEDETGIEEAAMQGNHPAAFDNSSLIHMTRRMRSSMTPSAPPASHGQELISEDSSLVHDIYYSSESRRSRSSYSRKHKSDASIMSAIGDESVYAETIEDLRLELDRTQFALSLEQRKGRPLKHVIGSQFRLPVGPLMKCEYCFNTDRHIKTSRDSIRTLKIQLTRSEEEVKGLRRAKHLDISTNMVKMRDELLVNQLLLQKQCDDFEKEIGFLKKKIYNDEVAFEMARKQMAEVQGAQKIADAKEREQYAESRNSDALAALEAVTSERDDLLKAVCQLKSGIQVFKLQLDQSEMKRRAVRRKSLEKIAEDKVIEDDTARVKSALFGREIEIASLTVKIEYLSADLVVASAQIVDLTEANKKSVEIREELKVAQRGLVRDIGNANHAAEQNSQRATELQLREAEARSLLGKESARIAVLEAELDGSSERGRLLREELDSLRAMYKEEHRQQMFALENAIANSVRLCVVAPTVNVHVTGEKFKLQSGLPENSIRDFIVYEVLSQYTFLFNQLEENSGPEASDLQEWIQNMLYTMQDSIESHVQAAMNDAT